MPAIAPLVIEELDLDDMEPEGLAPEIELELDAEGDIEDDVDWVSVLEDEVIFNVLCDCEPEDVIAADVVTRELVLAATVLGVAVDAPGPAFAA